MRSHHLRSLLAALGIAAVVASEPIRIWRLSGVERLHLSDGSSVVFKYATAPFTGEHPVLAELAGQGVPVADLRAATVREGILGMILEDLGDPLREPTEQDAALAAVRLHAADAPTWLEHLGESELAALPGRALTCLDQLTTAGRYQGTSDLREHLLTLTQAASTRAAGAQWPPFGLCHGELHPSTVHIGAAGWHLLDFAMTLHGPGLLDLAAWSGLRLPPDPPHTRSLIEHYVHAGWAPRGAGGSGWATRRALGAGLAPHPSRPLATQLRPSPASMDPRPTSATSVSCAATSPAPTTSSFPADLVAGQPGQVNNRPATPLVSQDQSDCARGGESEFWAEVGRALAAEKKTRDKAVRMLLGAEQLTPQRIRYDVVVSRWRGRGFKPPPRQITAAQSPGSPV